MTRNRVTRTSACIGAVILMFAGCVAPWDGDGSREPGGGLDGVARDGSGVPAVRIIAPADGSRVTNPVLFEVEAVNVAWVALDADGWKLGDSWDPAHHPEVSYSFSGVGYERTITLTGIDAWGHEVASHSIAILVEDDSSPPVDDGDPPGDGDPDCPWFESSMQEYAPVQTAGAGLPSTAGAMTWSMPASHTLHIPFSGTPGYAADHEGIDLVHDDPSVADVGVHAAADGVVVYVRIGCAETSLFSPNGTARECGSGWGNHVVIHHGDGVYTRYAHLRPGHTIVDVGWNVTRGQRLGAMGNSGRSQTRHLHLELGTSAGFDPCAPAQSLDAVHDPDLLPGF